MMDRRTLISAIALATVCARSGAFAQQQRSWRVGFVALPERPEPLEGSRFGAFALGMRETRAWSTTRPAARSAWHH